MEVEIASKLCTPVSFFDAILEIFLILKNIFLRGYNKSYILPLLCCP